MKEHGSALLKFLTEDGRSFRPAVLGFPLATAVGSFLFQLLVKDNSVARSLFSFAFVFLLTCFIVVVGELVRRGRLR